MRDKPAGVTERELRLALTHGWDLHGAELRYAPVGAGSYHWVARDPRGDRWFINVDDLDDKSWLGRSRPEAYAGLRAALDTTRALRDRAGLGFVAAPELAGDGATLHPVNPRYAVAVYPFLDGAGREFGDQLAGAELDQLVDMLAALHQVTPTPPGPVAQLGLSLRGELEAALGDLEKPWSGGLFSEPARALLAAAAGAVGNVLATFDRLSGQVAAAPNRVITHGEPHPGNVIQTAGGPMLIDWDTVGLAVPERDLWSLISDPGDEAARRYTRATGHAIDPDALDLYRIRWALDDIAAFTRQLRAPHSHTGDAEEAWQALNEEVTRAVQHAGS
jgi:spectinomycin phosphotransferase